MSSYFEWPKSDHAKIDLANDLKDVFLCAFRLLFSTIKTAEHPCCVLHLTVPIVVKLQYHIVSTASAVLQYPKQYHESRLRHHSTDGEGSGEGEVRPAHTSGWGWLLKARLSQSGSRAVFCNPSLSLTTTQHLSASHLGLPSWFGSCTTAVG